MGKVLLSLFALLVSAGLFSCAESAASVAPADVATDSAKFTTVQWIDTAVNFGSVTKGEKVNIKYKCKNTGSKPLFIYSVRPGCGCTVADYTKSAIMPGEMGEVDAAFDSDHGMPGEVRKSINVQTNTSNASPKLIFFGTVKAAAGEAGAEKKGS